MVTTVITMQKEHSSLIKREYETKLTLKQLKINQIHFTGKVYLHVSSLLPPLFNCFSYLSAMM